MQIPETNVHEIIRSHSMPLYHGQIPVVDLLREELDKISSELKTTVSDCFPNDFSETFYSDLKKTIIPLFDEQSRVIVKILEDADAVSPEISFLQLEAVLNKLRKEDVLRELTLENGLMSRIRQGAGPFERKDLFHISYQERKRAASQRYSRKSEPCLYLSVFPGLTISANEMVSLSWKECKMPIQFYASLFEAQEPLCFLHFAKKGTSYLFEYDHAKDILRKNDREQAIKAYLCTLPLRLACSVESRKETTNVNENNDLYLIPQLLMDWVKNCTPYHGIAYRSAVYSSDVAKYWSYNLALPVRTPDKNDGYDKMLKKLFKLSQPVQCDLREKINEIAEIGVNEHLIRTESHLIADNAELNDELRYVLSISKRFGQVCAKIKKDSATLDELFSLGNEVRENLHMFEKCAPDIATNIQYACCQTTPQILSLNAELEYKYI